MTADRARVGALVSIGGYSFEVGVSSGSEDRGRVVAARVERALSWCEQVLGQRPTLTVYVVNEEDWNLVADVPVFGMPQATPGKLVAPTAAAPWLRAYIDTVSSRLPPAERTRLAGECADGTELIDVVAVHELTHLTVHLDPETWADGFPALWLSELHANIGMVGYLTELEPAALGPLLTLAHATHTAGPDGWPITSLTRMADSLTHGPGHYVWFQMLLTLVAEQFWNAAGREGLIALRQRLLGLPAGVEQILEVIGSIDEGCAASLARWPSL